MNPEPLLEPDLPLEKAVFKRFTEFDWLHATFVQHSFAPHSHDGFVISVIERGVEAFSYQKTVHHAVAGSIIMVNPHEVHTGYAPLEYGWQYRCFYPSIALLEKVAMGLGWSGTPFFKHAVTRNSTLEKQLVAAHQMMNSAASQLEQDTILLEAFSALLLCYADTHQPLKNVSLEPVAVRVAREFLEANVAQNPSLEQLAAVTGLNEFTLLRAFKRLHGLPPHAFLVQRRLEFAKTALRHQDAVADVAAQFGFADQAHFTRLFKRTFGVTPAVYRNG